MKKNMLIPVFAFVFQVSNAQTVTGTWQGNLQVQPGEELPVVFHIERMGNSLKSSMDSPKQGVLGITTDTTRFINHQLQISINTIAASYTGNLTGNDSITGTFTQGEHRLPLNLVRTTDSGTVKMNRPQTPQPPYPYKTAVITITNPEQNNQLAGTLTLPAGDKELPVVVLITGSGPQDRDETLFGHKPFLVIADYFARHGIGSLRLDDRGVGGSEKGKEDATTADFATDIQAAVAYLKAKGYAAIGLVGHSEGGMIAPVVASKTNDVKFIISMAGPGIAIDSLMISQLKASSKAMNTPEAIININTGVARKAYSIVKSYTGNDLRNDLADSLLKNFPLVPDMDKAIAQTVSTPWFAYFIKFNPQQYIRQLKIPVLVLNGSKDVQVIARENLEGWKTSLEKGGNKNFAVKELPGLNHLFQQATTGAVAEYGQIEQTMAPAVLELMAGWILKNARAQ